MPQTYHTGRYNGRVFLPVDKLKTALVEEENHNTWCRSWEQIWGKVLSCHRATCLRFSTKNKYKQCAHIRDDQHILKVTPNSAKASMTCPDRACGAFARDAISSLCEEGAKQEMAHQEEFKLSQITKLESSQGLAFLLNVFYNHFHFPNHRQQLCLAEVTDLWLVVFWPKLKAVWLFF